MVTLSGPPDYTLVYWQWDRPRVSAHIQVGTNVCRQVSFNGTDYLNGVI
jgi:hypothetical protein